MIPFAKYLAKVKSISRLTNLVLAFALILVCIPENLEAQFENSAAGRLYVVAFPAEHLDKINSFANPDNTKTNVFMCLFSRVAQKVRITNPDGSVQIVDVPTRKPYIYDIVQNSKLVAGTQTPYTQAPDVIYGGRTFNVEAQEPIILYCYMENRGQAEAWSPVPCEQWGTEYYSANLPGSYIRYNRSSNAGGVSAPAEMVIAALDTNTQINFKVPGFGTSTAAATNPAGARTSVNLGTNDAFAIHSLTTITGININGSDLGGTMITSSKPIGLISGNTRSNGGFLPDTAFRGITHNSTKNMLMEAISPTQALGTEFVFMPTWDGRQDLGNNTTITGGSIRFNEIVRFYGTSQGNSVITCSDALAKTGLPTYMLQVANNSGTKLPTSPIPASKTTTAFSTIDATFFKSDKPTQAFSSSSAVAKQMYGGTTFESAMTSVYSQAPYMIELIPREQWVTEGAFFTPETDLDNFINIVTDSVTAKNQDIEIATSTGQKQKIVFNKKVKGSEFYWTTINVGINSYGYIRSNSGKFYAVCYGLGKDGKGFENQPLRGSYLEFSARSYGYPIAPSRYFLAKRDTVEISTVYACPELTVNAKVVNPPTQKKSGFRSVILENNVNSQILFVAPTNYRRVIGDTDIIFKIVPVNQSIDASATAVITDRTGFERRVNYQYLSETLTPLRDTIYLGEVNPDVVSSVTEVELTNTNPRNVTLKSVNFIKNVSGFAFDSSDPPLPATLKPGEKIKIRLTITAPAGSQTKVFRDSIVFQTECTKSYAVVYANRDRDPSIFVDDLDFGDLSIGESRTLPLKICNVGGGTITFKIPGPGREVLEWALANFTVSQNDILKLHNARLRLNDCVQIDVTFKADSEGVFRTVGYFYNTSQGKIRDTSVWSAEVKSPGPRISGYSFGTHQVVKAVNKCTKNDTASYDAIIDIWNGGKGQYIVDKIELVGADADSGFFVFGNRPAISKGDILRGQDSTEDNHRKQLIHFLPKNERTYSCKVRLTPVIGEVVEADLLGSGLETHVLAPAYNFGLLDTLGFYYYRNVKITSTGSRPLIITGVYLNGSNEFSFDPITILPKPGSPEILLPGESYEVPVRFATNTNGKKSTMLCITGNQPICEDSCLNITAEMMHIDTVPPRADVTVTKVRFNDISACENDSSEINVINTGEATLVIKSAILVSPNPAFVIGKFPQTKLLKGEQLSIPVAFYPQNDLFDSADVFMNCYDSTGTKVITSGFTKLFGKGNSLLAHTSVQNINSKLSNGDVNMPIILEDNNADTGNVSSITMNLNYETNSIILSSDRIATTLTKGTLLEGWGTSVSKVLPGFLSIVFTAPTGKYLKGKGTLLNLEFGLFLGTKLTNKVTYQLTANNGCVNFATTQALVTTDSTCGLRSRAIEVTGNNYVLEQNRPNPFNPSTDIYFELGLDGYTTLDVYNSLGSKVATLVSGYMKEGKYTLNWDATNYPSGLYYYALKSGVWHKTNSMILAK